MSEISFTISIQGDADGYVTFECPYCGSEFKLLVDEYQNEDEPFEELFCPYCGLVKDRNDFWSSEFKEKVEALAHNYMADEINKAFDKMAKSINRSGVLKMTHKPLKKVAVKDLQEKDTSETEFECDCCNHHVKVLYCVGESKIFCPYCGVDI